MEYAPLIVNTTAFVGGIVKGAKVNLDSKEQSIGTLKELYAVGIGAMGLDALVRFVEKKGNISDVLWDGNIINIPAPVTEGGLAIGSYYVGKILGIVGKSVYQQRLWEKLYKK